MTSVWHPDYHMRFLHKFSFVYVAIGFHQWLLTCKLRSTYTTGIDIRNTTANAMAVLRFQLRGLHHHPPAGDHTYFGYGYFFTAP